MPATNAAARPGPLLRWPPAPSPFRCVLVASRGQLAISVACGLREVGIDPVAVHSERDPGATHVLSMPCAVALGGETAAESRPRHRRVLAAARDTGCQAVHPGYGIPGENAGFAR